MIESSQLSFCGSPQVGVGGSDNRSTIRAAKQLLFDELEPTGWRTQVNFDRLALSVISRWCGDITYIPTDEGWLYLATTLDLGSRRLLGWSMADHMRAELVCDALSAAVATRDRSRMDHTIFHSDRGSQYASNEFTHACKRLGVRRSMGRTGSCLDNAVAESFFATLKVELCDRARYATRAEARTAVFRWIAYYNHRRLHSTLGYLTPVEWEHHHDDRQIRSALAA